MLDIFHKFCTFLDSSLELNVIRAMLAIKRNEDLEKNIKIIHSTIIKQKLSRKNEPNIIERYIGIDPQFLFEIAQELQKAQRKIPNLPLANSYRKDLVQLVMDLLRKITFTFPGSLRAWITLTKTMIDAHQYESAMNILKSCRRVHSQSSLVHLLTADVLVYLQQYSEANFSLEQSVSLDFSTKAHPFYKYIQSKILLHEVRR